MEATVRGYEHAIQEYDFAKADSFLAPNAKWIDALFRVCGLRRHRFLCRSESCGRSVTNEPHDFHTQIQGSVAWVTLLVDVTTVAENVDAGNLLARTETLKRQAK